MKHLAAAFTVAFIASKGFCGEGLPILISGHWATMTNTANFRELHSTTNIPPKVLGYVLSLPLGVQEADRQKMAEPGQPFTGFRLVWAATDSTNYIVHYEFLHSPDSRIYHTNFCIAAAFRDPKDESLKYCNGGYMRRLKGYKDFIEYERLIPFR